MKLIHHLSAGPSPVGERRDALLLFLLLEQAGAAGFDGLDRQLALLRDTQNEHG